MMLQRANAGALPQRHSCSRLAQGRVSRVAVRAATDDKLPKWDQCYKFLVEEKRLRTIQPKEAKALTDNEGFALVDVRPPDAYEEAHPAGSINVPMYQPIDWSKPSLGKVLKFIAYSSNGVAPVEPNPQFAEQMKQVASSNKGIITLCEAGGTLKPSTNFPFGKASRSLQAAYRALAQGLCDNVFHLDRGVYGWYQADLDFEGRGEYKPQIGRTPMAAPEPTLGVIRESTNYDQREGDKK